MNTYMAGSNGTIFILRQWPIGKLAQLIKIDTATRSWTFVEGGRWQGCHFLACLDDKVFTIFKPTSAPGEMRRFDAETLNFEDDEPDDHWPTPLRMTATGDKVYVIDGGEGGRLWGVNPDTLLNTGPGPKDDWADPQMMTALDGRIFVLNGGT